MGPASTTEPDGPKPGSAAAVTRGCTCPIMDNARGRGAWGDGARYGWWISADCPMHGLEPTPFVEVGP